MQPFFQQGWSLFAPNPAGGDNEILFRARWTDRSTGKLRTSDWVDVTRREWSGILHNPLHPGSDYYTDELDGILSDDRDNLNDNQASIVERDYSHSGWDQLLADLNAQKGADRDSLESYVRHERVTAAFATQYAYALWGPDVAQTSRLYRFGSSIRRFPTLRTGPTRTSSQRAPSPISDGGRL